MNRIRKHPGEVLQQEFLLPLGLSSRQVPGDLAVPANRLSDLVRGRRGVTADTAHRLAAYFGTTPRFWLNLQAAHDLSVAASRTDYSGIRRLEPA